MTFSLMLLTGDFSSGIVTVSSIVSNLIHDGQRNDFVVDKDEMSSSLIPKHSG